MFEIRTLPAPETVAVPGGVFTLTHTTERLVVDPRQKDALVLHTLKGFLDASGNFQDFGPIEVGTLDTAGLSTLLSDTTGGKPAGLFRTTDILPAIQKAKAK